jgi:2-amino-4-hydroxy-6-hydroxymethyldihydropteridine diphosphokinase
VPPSDQPWYANAVIEVATRFDPVALLGILHGIEREFGRERGAPNAARVLDLDLLAHSGEPVRAAAPELPHPRLHERGFVLLPLSDVAPDWRHPLLGRTVRELLADLPAEETAEIRRLAGPEGGRGGA